jgi:hypothetical protein
MIRHDLDIWVADYLNVAQRVVCSSLTDLRFLNNISTTSWSLERYGIWATDLWPGKPVNILTHWKTVQREHGLIPTSLSRIVKDWKTISTTAQHQKQRSQIEQLLAEMLLAIDDHLPKYSQFTLRVMSP